VVLYRIQILYDLNFNIILPRIKKRKFVKINLTRLVLLGHEMGYQLRGGVDYAIPCRTQYSHIYIHIMHSPLFPHWTFVYKVVCFCNSLGPNTNIWNFEQWRCPFNLHSGPSFKTEGAKLQTHYIYLKNLRLLLNIYIYFFTLFRFMKNNLVSSQY